MESRKIYTLTSLFKKAMRPDAFSVPCTRKGLIAGSGNRQIMTNQLKEREFKNGDQVCTGGMFFLFYSAFYFVSLIDS